MSLSLTFTAVDPLATRYDNDGHTGRMHEKTALSLVEASRVVGWSMLVESFT